MDELRLQDPGRIGAWRILARLGAGGMGQVYLGRSPGGRLVAVKVIRDEISDHPEALARFRREAATVETVRSAYTAQLIEASLDTSPYWLATEYVPGPTLRDAVGVNGPFPPESALRLLAALAEGLAAVHAHGVTHRDLKPQNVILAPQGPQLIDFGIARGLEQTILTRDGFAPGTPGYAAPEVVMRNDVGPAADIFALGATIAYTATGRPPYGVGDAAAVSYRAVHEDIDLTGVRDDLAALIRQCVTKDPAERPAPAAVIAECAVDSALAADAHYRSVARDADPVPLSGHVKSPPSASGAHAPSERETGTVTPAAPVTSIPPASPAPLADRGPAQPAPAPAAGTAFWAYSDTTPYDEPDHQPPARRGRRGALMAACVVALLVPVAVWLFPEEDGEGSGATPTTDAAGPHREQPRLAGPLDPVGRSGTGRSGHRLLRPGKSHRVLSADRPAVLRLAHHRLGHGLGGAAPQGRR
ncbi:serine/threonine-protein kinase [Streptomyces sp. L-9-10]|uniref:serine/threonine-protein kinase n=1 Tax=Streptomyces sp. L-9-10 TaxID=1478131 RepID=UPI001F02BA5F|nr:serine/threonine-protein kinase [Streptomyces sp. L-9-10]